MATTSPQELGRQPEFIEDGSCVIPILPDGRLVFQRRDGGTYQSPFMLGFFGGSIEEDDANAVMAGFREIGEETSLVEEGRVREQDMMVVTDGEYPYTNPRTGVSGLGKYTLLLVPVDDTEFDVREGAGAEAYELDEVLARDDVSKPVLYILQQVQDLLRERLAD